MKKSIPILAIVLVLVLSLSLFACRAEKEPETLTVPANATAEDGQTETEAPSTEATTAPEETSTEAVPTTETTTEATTEAPTQTPTTLVPETEPPAPEDETGVPAEIVTSPSPAPAPAAPTGKGAAIAATAGKLIGKPYEFGAAGPEKFDNSGFVYYCCKENGVAVPRKTSEIAGAGVAVDKNALQPGDIVLFALEEGAKTPDFAGIYIGNGTFVSCNNESVPTGTHVLTGFWGEHFLGGRRIG